MVTTNIISKTDIEKILHFKEYISLVEVQVKCTYIDDCGTNGRSCKGDLMRAQPEI